MTDRRIFRKLIDAMRLQRGRLDQQGRNIEGLRREIAELRAGRAYVRPRNEHNPKE